VRTLPPAIEDERRSGLERAIAGALRAAIHDHGAITADKDGAPSCWLSPTAPPVWACSSTIGDGSPCAPSLASLGVGSEPSPDFTHSTYPQVARPRRARHRIVKSVACITLDDGDSNPRVNRPDLESLLRSPPVHGIGSFGPDRDRGYNGPVSIPERPATDYSTPGLTPWPPEATPSSQHDPPPPRSH
jgi:hypothetical protein